jgi:hypothetical protein
MDVEFRSARVRGNGAAAFEFVGSSISIAG